MNSVLTPQVEKQWELKFTQALVVDHSAYDPAHDLLHIQRVVQCARRLTVQEGARWDVVFPAAWLHDLVLVPKNDPRRKEASRLSAQAAKEFLSREKYPENYLDEIAHAIEAHSFSAKIEARTLEAKIVQDADRLDGLGAIGIARCFATAGIMKRPFYSDVDPFCESREPNDGLYTVDHFYQKLFLTAQTLQTKAGRAEGLRRVESMKTYLQELKNETCKT